MCVRVYEKVSGYFQSSILKPVSSKRQYDVKDDVKDGIAIVVWLNLKKQRCLY